LSADIGVRITIFDGVLYSKFYCTHCHYIDEVMCFWCRSRDSLSTNDRSAWYNNMQCRIITHCTSHLTTTHMEILTFKGWKRS